MHCIPTMNRIIEVFKTNVCEPGEAKRMVAILSAHFPGSRINFDLQDCDKILRLEGEDFTIEKVTALVRQNGFECFLLE